VPGEESPERQSSMQRLLVATLIGGVVLAFALPFVSWQFSVLLGYDTAAMYLIVIVFVLIARFDAARTRASATREDDSRFAAQFALLTASVAALVAVAFALALASDSEGVAKFILILSGVGTTAISWLVVHTVYTLRYAHLYYAEPVGGIDFKCNDEPDYKDFAYLAFTVGMTFQVSDTDVTHPNIRHTVLRHALLSYLFGAVILAVLVNAIAGLFN
jgi:uncharacterized membrane protein